MKKIAILFVAILIIAPLVSAATSSVKAVPPLDNVLWLDRSNAIYMLIRNTTWDIRGTQDMDLSMLIHIRTSAETLISLMVLLPGPNPLLSLRLSFTIFLLARLFSIEDSGNFQHTIELYRQMIVPIREGIKTI